MSLKLRSLAASKTLFIYLHWLIAVYKTVKKNKTPLTIVVLCRIQNNHRPCCHCPAASQLKECVLRSGSARL